MGGRARSTTIQEGLRQVLAADLGNLRIRQVRWHRKGPPDGARAKHTMGHAREPRIGKGGRAQLRTNEDVVHIQGGNRIARKWILLGDKSKNVGADAGAAVLHSSSEQTSHPTTWKLLAAPLDGSAKPHTQGPSLATRAAESKSALDTNARMRAIIREDSLSAAVLPYRQGARVANCGCAGVSAPSPEVGEISATYPYTRRIFDAKKGDIASCSGAPSGERINERPLGRGRTVSRSTFRSVRAGVKEKAKEATDGWKG